MKKLAIFLALFVFAVVSYAQTDISVSGLKGNYDSETERFDINTNATYSFYYGTAADTISSTDSTWTKSYIIENLYDALKHELRIKLDSVSGTPTLNVALKGKWSTNDDWTSISNVDWAGSSSDTTIAISNGTAQEYRFLQVALDAVADSTQKAKVARIELGVYK